MSSSAYQKGGLSLPESPSGGINGRTTIDASLLANPDPEILPTDVQAVRDDAIIATGRSVLPKPN